MSDHLTSNLVPTLRDWQTTGLTGCALAGAAADEIDRLTADNKALREDAERYRYLCSLSTENWQKFADVMDNEIDAAIDAAIKGART